MRASQLTFLVLAVLLLPGCKFWPFGGGSGIKTPSYYGTFSIGAEGETTQLWADDAPPELPETVRFLVHEKAVHLGQNSWQLSRLSVAGPSVAAGALSWDDWYRAHGLAKGLESAANGSFPVNAVSVRLLRRPVKGEPEMIILEPAVPLTPGPYQLGGELRFWVARQQFNLDLSAAADAAVQDGDLRRAYNLAESAKLWNAGNPAIVAQFAQIQAQIEKVDGASVVASNTEPVTAPTVASRSENDPAPVSNSNLAAEAAFRQATTAFDAGEWAMALESALEAMKISRSSKVRTEWPKHRTFDDPIDVMLGIVTRPEQADAEVVCETSRILAQAGERRGPPAMAESLGVICLEKDAAERLNKPPVLCLVKALVDLRARAAAPMLRQCLSHVLSDLKTRPSADFYVNALVAVDGPAWRRFSPGTLDKVYNTFIEVNDRGADAVRLNPVDRKSANLGKINDFLAKIGRWDATDAANRSGLELGGSIGTRIRDRDMVEITYRIAGQASFGGDRFTLVLQPSESIEMPWRITDIRDVRIHGKPFPGDGVAASEFEPVSASPINDVSISPISLGGDPPPSRSAVAPEPDIDSVVDSTPGGPRISSRPEAVPKDVVAAICPKGTLGPLRHGSWYRQYFQDDALVDVRPANDPSPEEHNETRDLIHTGIDILAPEGTPVYALTSGIVRMVINNPDDGSFRALGYALIVRHATGDNKTYCLYSHLKDPPKLLSGNNIHAGELIGHTGKTGNAEEPQVHVEIRHFREVFDLKLFDAFGNAMAQDPTTFDIQYLNSKWSDPLQFQP
jgi:hypothetical protein